jgi:lipopolysaccharide/colanic/teichoic acid biosynthesis glycosyltransferase
MDMLALPTYREGFPGAPLEAQAASVPVVTTDATGATDAIVDGVTGLRVAVGDVDALTAVLDRLLCDSALRARLGRAGCQWVEENFRREAVWQSLLESYRSTLEAGPSRRVHFRRLLKASCERLAAAVALVATAPVWLVAAVAVRCSMGAPVLFRQQRPGLCARPFTLLKFRTMRELRDQDGALLEDGRRMTWLGRLLRSLSLDELPQLWNVLRGEMSFVGPRPLLTQYLDRYTPEQARRHEVLPGITGWAQVNGRNAIGWEEKFALDVWYVDHWSVWLDLRILARTLRIAVRRDGISSRDHATMPEFRGAEERRKLT